VRTHEGAGRATDAPHARRRALQVRLLVHARAPSFFKSGEQAQAAQLARGDKGVAVPKNLAHLCSVLAMDPLTQALEATEELARRRAMTIVTALVEHELDGERLLASWQGFSEAASIEMTFFAAGDDGAAGLPQVGLRRALAFGGTAETDVER